MRISAPVSLISCGRFRLEQRQAILILNGVLV